MINKYNIAELSLVDRPVQGTQTGFGAVITRHEGNHAARYFATENTDNYGERIPAGPQETTHMYNMNTANLAGGHIRPEDQQGIKKISNLVGEVYSKSFDP